MTNEVVIKGGYGGRIEVRRDQILEIINDGGQQVCDIFAFNSENFDETLSPAHTRSALRRVILRVGDLLISRFREPLFEIIEATCGQHDITFPPCDPVVYEQRFGIHDHRSCRTNLAEAIADMDIPYAFLPEPVHFFQNTPIPEDGAIKEHLAGQAGRQGGVACRDGLNCRWIGLPNGGRRQRRSAHGYPLRRARSVRGTNDDE